MSQWSIWSFQEISISSVILSSDQKPTRTKAVFLKAAITPDTVKILPYVLCARLIKPIIEENSPTCNLPKILERFKI